MLEAKYYKDHRHNYMILQCEREEASSSYQHKILVSDKIGEILRCSVRHINGATYYYYDISSRTTLEGLYRGKKMSYGQVRDVFGQIYGICDRLAGYFMEETKLVLEPEHIYYDMTNNKYIGLYYPDYQAQGADVYRPLMDFLLEHIDTQDEQLTENMYQIYEMAEENHFCIEDALKMLEQKDESVYESAHETVQEPGRIPDWEKDRDQILDGSGIYDMAEEFRAETLQAEKTDGGKSRRRLFYLVFMVLSALGMAGAAAVGTMYELTQEEQVTLYGAMAAMGVCILLCLTGMVRGRGKEMSGRGNQADRRNQTDRVSKADRVNQTDQVNQTDGRNRMKGAYFPEEGTVSLEHVISRDMDLDMTEDEPAVYRTARGRNTTAYRMNVNPMDSEVAPDFMREGVNCGNTVFFDASKMEECKLYAVDQKNKRHIELRQFPCTVGKMAGCVDHVLTDDSVSRIHARFDRQGEKLLLTDMNSTNGTYKNGLRMQPQETVEIEPGDEIRFGSLNYCYR